MKKILLIHGWNYRNYTSQTEEKDAWHNRMKLVELLKKNYEVYRLNLPGFCGEKEPNKAWELHDYAKYIKDYLNKNKLQVDYILGYSFGGAVAISYYLEYGSGEKLILVSPAIIRNNDKSKKFVKTPGVFDRIRKFLRNQYIIHIVKTPEMVYGTKFLRDTYQIIVRKDLKEEVLKVPNKDILIIYGEKDDMVNPNGVINFLPKEYKKRIKLIKDGDHNIGQTHYKEIVNLIKENI
ncbi:MAG: alpha/beta hydrolase [Firmicutes bacterium]|nr:alpha/beta hydrolase [Bacillota bacterium]